MEDRDVVDDVSESKQPLERPRSIGEGAPAPGAPEHLPPPVLRAPGALDYPPQLAHGVPGAVDHPPDGGQGEGGDAAVAGEYAGEASHGASRPFPRVSRQQSNEGEVLDAVAHSLEDIDSQKTFVTSTDLACPVEGCFYVGVVPEDLDRHMRDNAESHCELLLFAVAREKRDNKQLRESHAASRRKCFKLEDENVELLSKVEHARSAQISSDAEIARLRSLIDASLPVGRDEDELPSYVEEQLQTIRTLEERVHELESVLASDAALRRPPPPVPPSVDSIGVRAALDDDEGGDHEGMPFVPPNYYGMPHHVLFPGFAASTIPGGIGSMRSFGGPPSKRFPLTTNQRILSMLAKNQGDADAHQAASAEQFAPSDPSPSGRRPQSDSSDALFDSFPSVQGDQDDIIDVPAPAAPSTILDGLPDPEMWPRFLDEFERTKAVAERSRSRSRRRGSEDSDRLQQGHPQGHQQGHQQQGDSSEPTPLVNKPRRSTSVPLPPHRFESKDGDGASEASASATASAAGRPSSPPKPFSAEHMRQIEVFTKQAAELREYVRRREAEEKRLAYEQEQRNLVEKQNEAALKGKPEPMVVQVGPIQFVLRNRLPLPTPTALYDKTRRLVFGGSASPPPVETSSPSSAAAGSSSSD